MYRMVLDVLFEQTDEAMKFGFEDQAGGDDLKGSKGKIRLDAVAPDNGSRTIFSRTNRINLLSAFFNQAVILKKYDISYEVTKRFMSDLLKAKHLPIFEKIFFHFIEETSRIETKLILMIKCMPLMDRN